MEGPGNNRPVKRAGDSNTPHGAPEVRDWQRNTWTGPMPMNVSPFEEPDDAPELLQQRSENLRDREGAFWQQATNGYQRTAGNETQRTNAAKTGKSSEKTKNKKTGGTSAGMKAALALVALTFITICALYFIVFRVREIKVEGNELISRSDVIRLSGIQYGESILTLSEEDTKQQLEAQAISEAKRTGNSNYYSLQFRYLDKLMPGTVVKAGATVEYAILGENTVIGPGAVVGTAPDGTEGWGVATCGPNVTVSAGKVILAGAMIYSGEEG